MQWKIRTFSPQENKKIFHTGLRTNQDKLYLLHHSQGAKFSSSRRGSKTTNRAWSIPPATGDAGWPRVLHPRVLSSSLSSTRSFQHSVQSFWWDLNNNNNPFQVHWREQQVFQSGLKLSDRIELSTFLCWNKAPLQGVGVPVGYRSEKFPSFTNRASFQLFKNSAKAVITPPHFLTSELLGCFS